MTPRRDVMHARHATSAVASASGRHVPDRPLAKQSTSMICRARLPSSPSIRTAAGCRGISPMYGRTRRSIRSADKPRCGFSRRVCMSVAHADISAMQSVALRDDRMKPRRLQRAPHKRQQHQQRHHGSSDVQ